MEATANQVLSDSPSQSTEWETPNEAAQEDSPVLEDLLIMLGYSDGLDEVRATHIRTAVLAHRFSLENLLQIDHPVQVNLNDEISVRKELAKLRDRYSVKGLVAFDDALVGLAARATSWLDLQHGPRFQNVQNCLRKDKMREVLSQDPLLAVRYQCAASEDELEAAIKAIGLPCITKPLDSNNSKYVQFCDSEAKALAAGKRILDWSEQTSGQPQVLIETYLEGPEFSVESYTLDGKTQIMAVCEKVLGPLPYFIEIGHYLPTRQPPDVEENIAETARKALRLLQIDNLVTHTELRLTPSGIKIIEVNPRPAGGRLRDFVRSVTGYDLHEAAIQTAVGLVPHRHPPVAAFGVYYCPIAEGEGMAVYDASYLRQRLATGTYPVVEITVQPGEPVYPINHKEGKILGRILAYGSSFEAVEEEIRRIFWGLKFQVIPGKDQTGVAKSEAEETSLNFPSQAIDTDEIKFKEPFSNGGLSQLSNWSVSFPPGAFQFASASPMTIPVWSPVVGWTWLYLHPQSDPKETTPPLATPQPTPTSCQSGECGPAPSHATSADQSVIPDEAGAWDRGCC